MNDDTKKLLDDWELQTKQIYRAHYGSAIKCRSLNQWLGLPSAVLSAVAATTIFATAAEGGNLTLKVVTGAITLIVTILAALQTFLRFSERAEKHQTAGAGFAALNREISQLIAEPPDKKKRLAAQMGSIRSRWEELSRNSPVNFQSAWKVSAEKIRKEYGISES
jgi:hypothetical protein